MPVRGQRVRLEIPDDRPEIRDAFRLLRTKGYHPSRVVAAHSDCILWLDQNGKPRTSFVAVAEEKGRMTTFVSTPHDGFVA